MTHPSSSEREVDQFGNCIRCGGIHYGTGFLCVFNEKSPYFTTPVTVPEEQREDKWIREMAAKEDGCFVNIGSPLEHVMLARTRDYNMVQDGAKQDQKIRELEAELSRLTEQITQLQKSIAEANAALAENESLKADREKMVAAKRKNR